ncbi:hypothetical protein [Nitrosophilus kaiyonis]|uniref:hypothetical protein n=1 Tax=Nitrosophilus kaiyonis TaxID=2930200 RepID=UPI0024920BF9|nr:hypothetical protein [Nitrosophilus kaiyonis]
MFLTPEVFINIFVDFLILIFCFFAFIIAIRIVLYFDFTKDTPLQYSLQSQSYLAQTVVKFAFFLKIPLIFYFIYTLDKLSNIIPGAMCAAGVVTANEYGVYLLALKIINIYLFGIWLLINSEDLKTKDYKFTKLKFKMFIIFFILLFVEFVLEILYFNGIDVSKIVSCCGVLFNPVKTSPISLILKIPHQYIVFLFYITFILILLFGYLKRAFVFSVLNIFFLFISILAIIVFFSPYIYELPTHRCPFCILQKEYFYIGYIIYANLFLGTFFGISQGVLKFFLKKEKNFYNKSLFFNFLFVIIVTSYVIVYFIKNGVWLF